MAIHKIVYYAQGRHLRITVSVGPRSAQKFRIERDLVLITELSTLAMLESWLHQQGIELSDLEED